MRPLPYETPCGTGGIRWTSSAEWNVIAVRCEGSLPLEPSWTKGVFQIAEGDDPVPRHPFENSLVQSRVLIES